MGTNSGIEYVEHSLNFWVGCTPVPDSPGCDHCYARREMKRYGRDPFKVVRTSKATWRQPLVKSRQTGRYKWKPGARVFVCSWSDFFHPDADQWRTEAWGLMRKRPDLMWVIVTKRIEQAMQWIPVRWPWRNRMIIVTAENQQKADERIPQLLKLKELFPNLLLGISFEPLLGPVSFRWKPYHYQATGETYRQYLERTGEVNEYESFKNIDQITIGCESGPKRRPCKLEWVLDLVNQCKAAGVPVFVKQLSINGKVSHNPKEWPEDLRIREFPSVLQSD